MSSRLDERIRQMMQKVVDESPAPPELPAAPPRETVNQRRAPGWAVAVGTATVVFALIGGAALLNRGPHSPATEPVAPPDSFPTSIAPTTTVDALAARDQGVSFDFTIHDLCEWFTPDEIRDFVVDAYREEGVAYPIPAELEKRDIATPMDGCSWSAVGVGDFPDLITFDVLVSEVSGDLAGYEGYIHANSIDWGVSDLMPDGVVFLGHAVPNVFVEDTEQLLHIGHIPAAPIGSVNDGDSDFTAWVNNGVSPWLRSTERLRVQVRLLNAMLDDMNWVADSNG